MPYDARSWCIARGTLPETVQYKVFVVPDNHTLILKDLRVWGAANTPDGANLYAVSPTRDAFILLAQIAFGAQPIASWSGWIVANAGYSVEILAYIPNLYYWVSGALLTANAQEPIQPPLPTSRVDREPPPAPRHRRHA